MNRKILLRTALLMCAAIVMCAQGAKAQATWFGNSYIVINGNQWYNGSGSGNGNFNNLKFTNDHFTLNGQVRCYPDYFAAMNPKPVMHWQIDNADAGSLTLDTHTGVGGTNNNDGIYEAAAPVEVSGLSKGTHSIKVWFTLAGVTNTNELTSGYTATFTYYPNPSFQLVLYDNTTGTPGHRDEVGRYDFVEKGLPNEYILHPNGLPTDLFTSSVPGASRYGYWVAYSNDGSAPYPQLNSHGYDDFYNDVNTHYSNGTEFEHLDAKVSFPNQPDTLILGYFSLFSNRNYVLYDFDYNWDFHYVPFGKHDVNSARGAWKLMSAPQETAWLNDFKFPQGMGVGLYELYHATPRPRWRSIGTTQSTIEAGRGFAYIINATDPLSNRGYGDGWINLTHSSSLVTHDVEDIPLDVKYTLLGNPFVFGINMTHLDGNVKKAGWYTCQPDGQTFPVKNGSSDYVSSWEGFIVQNEEGVANGNVAIRYDPVPAQSSGAPSSYSINGTVNFTAANLTGESRTYINNNAYGSTTVGNWDLSFLNMGENEYVQVYTTKTDANGQMQQLAINTVNSDNISVPVGVFTKYTGTATFTLEGMNTCDCYVTLVDNLTGDPIDLSGMERYAFDAVVNGNSAERFTLIFAPVPAGTEKTEISNIQTFVSNGQIEVVATEGLQNVTVFNVGGSQVVNRNAEGRTSYTISDPLPAGIYLVRIATKNEVKTQKVVLK
ncbi:MAG: T9SS type A sorting domain-containing protein [Prevotellaceae bacterium]|jgi:hypothetical protein|nr:T9SS type A sorting domain-containing protein [Prevotellaceae bacterium]